jgi:TolB-like protein
LRNPVRFGRCEVRPEERQLLVEGRPVRLGTRAFDLLLCLLAHRDRVVTKDEALMFAWPGRVVEENNLSVQVSALRKVIGPDAITSIAGRGYRFSMAVTECAPPADVEARGPGTPVADRPTIAVLPFPVLSDDLRVRFLVDGLAEDVIALLARVPGFLLISHASSFAFRGQQASLPDVARQLGVRYVVEGSVRAVGTLLRVSVQLVDATSGRVLWTGRFDSPRDSALDLQEDIARGIITQLEPELTRAEIAHIRRQRPANLDAWAHYHQAVGAVALQGWGADAMAEARGHLLESVNLDPSFGLGYAQYALLTALARNLCLVPDDKALVDEAVSTAERALALDHGSSEVLGYAGCALCDLGHKERGIEVIEHALELDPSNAQAHVGLGAALCMNGQLQAGVEKMQFGMKISPRDRRLGFWGWALGSFMLRADRADEALAEAQVSGRRDPRLHLARVLQAAALERLGRMDKAVAALSVARRLRPQLTPFEVAMTHGRRAGEGLAPLWGKAG